MKRVILILILLLLLGCQWAYDRNKDITFDNIPVMGFETVEEVIRFVAARTSYHSDSIHDTDEYWQSPDQTYIWKTGDCEDFCILAMYLIYQELGLEPCLVAGTYVSKFISYRHGWVEVNDEWWEPQGGWRCDSYQDRFTDIYTINYAEVIYRSTHRHKALRQEE